MLSLPSCTREEQNIWIEMGSNQGPLTLQATGLTTRLLLLGHEPNMLSNLFCSGKGFGWMRAQAGNKKQVTLHTYLIIYYVHILLVCFLLLFPVPTPLHSERVMMVIMCVIERKSLVRNVGVKLRSF